MDKKKPVRKIAKALAARTPDGRKPLLPLRTIRTPAFATSPLTIAVASLPERDRGYFADFYAKI